MKLTFTAENVRKTKASSSRRYRYASVDGKAAIDAQNRIYRGKNAKTISEHLREIDT